MTYTRIDIKPDVLARARLLRDEGMGWVRIGEQLGVHSNTIRDRLDPTFAERYRFSVPSVLRTSGEVRIPPEAVARALATVPADTRPILARFMGDPLPGRSALDRRRETA